MPKLQPAAQSLVLPNTAQPTEPNILGPYYRPAAPTRYTILSPCEPGTVMLIRGRVWGNDTKAPLAGAAFMISRVGAASSSKFPSSRNSPRRSFAGRLSFGK